MSKKILIIGQDELIKNSLAAELEKKDYIIEITVNLVLGIEKIKDKEIDLVILNAGLKKINALETGKRIKKNQTRHASSYYKFGLPQEFIFGHRIRGI